MHSGHCSYVICVFTSGHPKLTVFIKLIKSLLHFFWIWLKTNILRLWRKDNYQCSSTARILASHYLCRSSSLHHFNYTFLLILQCVNHYVCVNFDMKQPGRLMSLPGSRKPNILGSCFCGLVFQIWPQVPDEPACTAQKVTRALGIYKYEPRQVLKNARR